MRRNLLFVMLVASVFLAAVILFFPKSNSTDTPTHNQIGTGESAYRYMPLGDSYTIGTSVKQAESFPYQLTEALQKSGVSIEIVGNPSRSGNTSLDVIKNQIPALKKSDANFVTLLIGVNDQVQGTDVETFRKRFSVLIDELEKAKPNAKIVILTIPDYSVTAKGKTFGAPEKTQSTLKAYNAVIFDEARKEDLPVVDIFTLSQGAQNDSSFTASDGLHPSGKQYQLWTETLLPIVKSTLTPR